MIEDPLRRMTRLGGRAHEAHSLGSVYAGSVTRFLPALSISPRPTHTMYAEYDAHDAVCIAAVRDEESSSVRLLALFDQLHDEYAWPEQEAAVLCETGEEATWAKLKTTGYINMDLLCALPTPGLRGCFAIIPSSGEVALQSELGDLDGRRKELSATPYELMRMRNLLTRAMRLQHGQVLRHCCANKRYVALLYADHWPGADMDDDWPSSRKNGALIRVLPREAAMAAGAKPCQFGGIDLAAVATAAGDLNERGTKFGELASKFRPDFCSLCFLPDGEHIAVADTNVSSVFVFHVSGALVRTVIAGDVRAHKDIGIYAGCCSIACTGQELLVLLSCQRKIAVFALATMEHAAVLHVPIAVNYIAACGATVYAFDRDRFYTYKWTAA